MLKRILRPVWHRRHLIIRDVKRVFGWTFHMLGQLPLPNHVKMAIRDVVMLCVSCFVVHTEGFSRWQRERGGTTRIQQWIKAQPDEKAPKAALPVAPSDEMWEWLANHVSATPQEVTLDVIVPVYSGYDQTLNAIYLAIATKEQNTTPYHIVVIDDASPDSRLSEKLKELAAKGLFELHINEQNLGFVKTVNKAMKLHEQRDIILLNADTEVYNHWVDRLVAAASSIPMVASVTPLSNNAEICSYPHFVQDNNMPLELSYAELDRLTAEVNHKAVVEVPTGVGFCMYISRASLTKTGYFDVDHFGRGYGEENDFCMRAMQQGFRHLLACDTFVRHIGGTSFGSSKKKLVMKNYDILCRLHPAYPKLVQSFLQNDPVKPYRRALDIARLRRAYPYSNNILMVNHQMGGGTGKQVRELCESLQSEGVGGYIMEPAMTGAGIVLLRAYGVEHTPNLLFSMEYDRDAFIATLEALHISHVHIHHVINFPQRVMDFLHIAMQQLQLHYDITLHDYYTICPRINLVDGEGYYCGEPVVTACESCIEVNHSHAAGVPVWQWREQFHQLLRAARKIFVPDTDVLQRIASYYDVPQLTFRPHAERFDDVMPLQPVRQQGEPMRVAVIGAISGIKGSKVLANLVKDANKRGLSLEYILIGHTDNPDLNAGMPRFRMSGEYQEAELETLLKEYQPHLVMIPSIWPETYCYTLSVAWRFGIKPVVFDIGAPAARIRAIGEGQAGEILPYAFARQPEWVNDWLMAYKGSYIPSARPENVSYDSYWLDYYGLDGKLVQKAA